MKESDVLEALRLYHRQRGEQFFSHVKMGESWSYGKTLRILDGFALKPSWANSQYYGYEVKVSRSDFHRDNKWQEYLPVCTTFSFACPDGLIKPEELPAGIGLIYCLTDGSLKVAKRPQKREVDVVKLADLMKYLVLYRVGRRRDHIAKAQRQVGIERDKCRLAEKDEKMWRNNYFELEAKMREWRS